MLLQGFQGFGFGDGGFHMSFGIGAFPFGIFASSFNLNDGRPGPRKYFLKQITYRCSAGFTRISRGLFDLVCYLVDATNYTPHKQ